MLHINSKTEVNKQQKYRGTLILSNMKMKALYLSCNLLSSHLMYRILMNCTRALHHALHFVSLFVYHAGCMFMCETECQLLVRSINQVTDILMTCTITVLNCLFYESESMYVTSTSVFMTESYSHWVSWT
jgi:high-affinity nickel permease